MRNLFRLLLVLQIALFVLLEHAGLTWLRITEFGERGDPKAWGAVVGVLNIGLATAYLAALFISARSRKLLGIESLTKRLAHLGMTVAWPVLIGLVYGALFGYPAS
jgi:hypothetical protein